MDNVVTLRLPELAPYTFPAISEARRCSVPMTFARVDAAAGEWLRSVWKEMVNAAKKACTLTGRPAPKWLNWQPWQWCFEKALLEAGRTPVLAWAEEYPAGFLTLWPPSNASGALYIEHLAATPGDMSTPLWGKRYHKVGWSLMAYVIHVSKENGFGGRVGLHAAEDAVLTGVYRRYEAAVPGLFRPDQTGIPGPTPYGAQKSLTLTYLETTEEGAARFLEGFRNA